MTRSTHSEGFHPSSRSAGTLCAVALGGALGTLARYALECGLPTASGHFPTATLVINLSGSFLIGLLLPFALVSPHSLLRPFLVTGILGGWTTYSALATDAVSLIKSGHALLAVGDLGTTLVAGLALVTLGFFVSPSHSLVRYRRSRGS
jgi:CrcB protein